MHNWQLQEPSGGLTNGGERQYMWYPRSQSSQNSSWSWNPLYLKNREIGKFYHTYVIITCATHRAALALNTLPSVLLHGNLHIIGELKTSGMAWKSEFFYEFLPRKVGALKVLTCIHFKPSSRTLSLDQRETKERTRGDWGCQRTGTFQDMWIFPQQQTKLNRKIDIHWSAPCHFGTEKNTDIYLNVRKFIIAHLLFCCGQVLAQSWKITVLTTPNISFEKNTENRVLRVDTSINLTANIWVFFPRK